MSVVEFRKLRCDNCRKERVVEGFGSHPSGWLEISITRNNTLYGCIVFLKDACCDNCALEIMKKISRVPKITVRRD